MDLSSFKESLHQPQPPEPLTVHQRALWYDGQGNWEQSHTLIQDLDDVLACLIHAYLHRKEGDTWNADYWYRKAKAIRPDISLAQEWEQLVLQTL